jgi:hypothetical protein
MPAFDTHAAVTKRLHELGAVRGRLRDHPGPADAAAGVRIAAADGDFAAGFGERFRRLILGAQPRAVARFETVDPGHQGRDVRGRDLAVHV